MPRDVVQGYAVLEDLGSTHMLTALNLRRGCPPALYAARAGCACAPAAAWRQRFAAQLPPYDRATLLREMQLLPDWYCRRHHRQFDPAPAEEDAAGTKPSTGWPAEALAQPQVFVHRDYHSRNLMMTPGRSPGVIDFQDALRGPVGYDLASILKDCYVDWPRAQVEALGSRLPRPPAGGRCSGQGAGR